jgi:hypothetical protein
MCLIGPPLRARFWPYIVDEIWMGNSFATQRVITWSDGTQTVEFVRENLLEQAMKQKRERRAKSLIGKKLQRWPDPGADQTGESAAVQASPPTD